MRVVEECSALDARRRLRAVFPVPVLAALVERDLAAIRVEEEAHEERRGRVGWRVSDFREELVEVFFCGNARLVNDVGDPVIAVLHELGSHATRHEVPRSAVDEWSIAVDAVAVEKAAAGGIGERAEKFGKGGHVHECVVNDSHQPAGICVREEVFGSGNLFDGTLDNLFAVWWHTLGEPQQALWFRYRGVCIPGPVDIIKEDTSREWHT